MLEISGFTDLASSSEGKASTYEEKSAHRHTAQAHCESSALSFLMELAVVNLNTCALREGKHLNSGNIKYSSK